jgi:hypothetical protein
MRVVSTGPATDALDNAVLRTDIIEAARRNGNVIQKSIGL